MKRLSLGCTAVIGALVFVAALEPPDLLVWINLFAFGGLEAVFLWPILLGLYWNGANARGALASIVTGLALFIALTVFKTPLGGCTPLCRQQRRRAWPFWRATVCRRAAPSGEARGAGRQGERSWAAIVLDIASLRWHTRRILERSACAARHACRVLFRFPEKGRKILLNGTALWSMTL